VAGAVALALPLLAACGSSTSRIAVRSSAHASASRPAQSATASQRSAPPSTTAPTSSSHSAGAGAIPQYDHVVVAVFENKPQTAIVNSPAAPYFTLLATSGADFTDAHAITHPSEPNYLALFSGSDQGVPDDSCPHQFDAPDLGGQLIAAQRSFIGYSEDLPGVGSTACSAPAATGPTRSGYARKHNPWVDFTDVPASANQPFDAFPRNFAQLPTVSFVIPNLCHDMHDCPVADGDTWLRANLSAYAQWARTHNSLLIVTFDEDDSSSGNRITTIFFGAHIRAGRYGQRIDHYSVLRTLETMYGLVPLGGAASTPAISGIWT
jgi:hypothetical protein